MEHSTSRNYNATVIMQGRCGLTLVGKGAIRTDGKGGQTRINCRAVKVPKSFKISRPTSLYADTQTNNIMAARTLRIGIKCSIDI